MQILVPWFYIGMVCSCHLRLDRLQTPPLVPRWPCRLLLAARCNPRCTAWNGGSELPLTPKTLLMRYSHHIPDCKLLKHVPFLYYLWTPGQNKFLFNPCAVDFWNFEIILSLTTDLMDSDHKYHLRSDLTQKKNGIYNKKFSNVFEFTNPKCKEPFYAFALTSPLALC